jgi:hypothetical protein
MPILIFLISTNRRWDKHKFDTHYWTFFTTLQNLCTIHEPLQASDSGV